MSDARLADVLDSIRPLTRDVVEKRMEEISVELEELRLLRDYVIAREELHDGFTPPAAVL